MELDESGALITDGRFSGATRGAAIGYVPPRPSPPSFHPHSIKNALHFCVQGVF